MKPKLDLDTLERAIRETNPEAYTTLILIARIRELEYLATLALHEWRINHESEVDYSEDVMRRISEGLSIVERGIIIP